MPPPQSPPDNPKVYEQRVQDSLTRFLEQVADPAAGKPTELTPAAFVLQTFAKEVGRFLIEGALWTVWQSKSHLLGAAFDTAVEDGLAQDVARPSELIAIEVGAIQDELTSICAETHQTVFMITHDVDEAILLADKILLMTNGPQARIAEIVVNTLPRVRSRHDIHHHPHYYRLRNHLVDFLVHRSKLLQEGREDEAASEQLPRVVMPGLADHEIVPGEAAERVPALKQVK